MEEGIPTIVPRGTISALPIMEILFLGFVGSAMD
jgi:hypothetical protein